MSTKGSWQRPCNQEQFDKNYEAIFGKTKEKSIEKPIEETEEHENSTNGSNPS